LCPLSCAVIPKTSPHRIVDVAVKPARKLRTAGTKGQQLAPDGWLYFAPVLLDGTEQTQHGRQSLHRTQLAIVGHAGVELVAEVVDDRAVEVAAGGGQGRLDVLLLVDVQRRRFSIHCHRLVEQFLELLGRHLQAAG